jgi:hypothetical protein
MGWSQSSELRNRDERDTGGVKDFDDFREIRQ